MAIGNPAIVTIRGTQDYGKGLDRLLRKVQANGGNQILTRHQLGVYALELLASQHGMRLPARSRPLGTNRYGPPNEFSRIRGKRR
jgi:hypothetical protein